MEKSAGIVIFREKKGKREYLLLEYKFVSQFWSFSKGIIEEGESEQQAALREAEEETGLKNIELIPDFREKTSFFKTREGKKIFKEVVWFLGKVQGGEEAIVSAEHQALKWVSYAEALRMLKHKNDKALLEKAEKKAEKMEIRKERE